MEDIERRARQISYISGNAVTKEQKIFMYPPPLHFLRWQYSERRDILLFPNGPKITGNMKKSGLWDPFIVLTSASLFLNKVHNCLNGSVDTAQRSHVFAEIRRGFSVFWILQKFHDRRL